MMKIGAGIPSFYNASSKIQSLGNTEEIQKISGRGTTQADQEKSGQASQYIAEHGGVIQTRVSPENAYQKAKLDSPRAQVEDMADKLMSKMPRIFEDMSKIADSENVEQAQRVVVNERNAAAVAEKNADMNNKLMNFTL